MMTKDYKGANKDSRKPLAAVLRPTELSQFYGQKHLLENGKSLANSIASKKLQSMLFWGPPGSGKTTLANLLAQIVGHNFIILSATASGVKDVKAVAVDAELLWGQQQKKTIVFIDEIHRFNKAQQDALLPAVENGTFILIGATTENPSFAVNNALLSRLTVYQLYALEEQELLNILNNAIDYVKQEYDINIDFGVDKSQEAQELQKYFIALADNDARKLLNNLELLLAFAPEKNSLIIKVTKELLKKALGTGFRKFDKGGDIFYEQISALHKAVRGSHPDAALYWFARMLDGGCDPLYIARRVLRMASEDIGNAEPRGLQLALNAYDTYQRLGSPEGELAIAQAIVFLAVAPKSNAVYVAFGYAMADAQYSGSLGVPLHLRNAPTKFMKNLGYGAEYKYDHDEVGGIALSQSYFPDRFSEKIYYSPKECGLEIKIKEKLDNIRKVRGK